MEKKDHIIQNFAFYYYDNVFIEFKKEKKEEKKEGEKNEKKEENKEEETVNDKSIKTSNQEEKKQTQKKKSSITKITQKKPLKKITRIKSLPLPKFQSKKEKEIQKTTNEKFEVNKTEESKKIKLEEKKEQLEEKKEKLDEEKKIKEIKKVKNNIIIQISNPNIIDINSFPEKYHSNPTIQTMNLSYTFDPHINYIHCILKLQDGRIASSSSDETIKIFNKDNFNLDITLKGHYGGIFNLFQLPNTKLLSASADNTIRLWNLETKTFEKTFIGHNFTVYKAILLNNNKDICSCSADKTFKIWNLENTKCLKTLKGHEGYITAFLEYENNKLISVGTDDTVRFWNINLNDDYDYENFMIMKKIGNFQDHNGLLKIKNNRVIISGNSDGTIIIVNVKYYQIECRIKVHVGFTNSIIVMDDNTILTSGDDVILKQWDLDTYIQIGERNNYKINWIISMAQIDDKNGKKRIVGCTLDNKIHVFEY